MTSALYDTDPYLWSQEQAALLKAGRWEEVDAALVAEEIADIGSEIRNACFSFIRRILEHLLKLQYSTQHDARPHWRSEIAHFRVELKDRLTRSIENQVDLARLYGQAARLAATGVADREPDFVDRLPEDCPWTLLQILDDDFWPESPPKKDRS